MINFCISPDWVTDINVCFLLNQRLRCSVLFINHCFIFTSTKIFNLTVYFPHGFSHGNFKVLFFLFLISPVPLPLPASMQFSSSLLTFAKISTPSYRVCNVDSLQTCVPSSISLSPSLPGNAWIIIHVCNYTNFSVMVCIFYFFLKNFYCKIEWALPRLHEHNLYTFSLPIHVWHKTSNLFSFSLSIPVRHEAQIIRPTNP